MSSNQNKGIVGYSRPTGDTDCAHEFVFEVADIDMPEPGGDEVLVKVEAAPIHPSDLGRMQAGGLTVAKASEQQTRQDSPTRLVTPFSEGLFQKDCMLQSTTPTVYGNEGCGIVVAAGSEAQGLMGKRVCFLSGKTYSLFSKVAAKSCIPLPPDVTAELGAAAFVNPQTAVGFVQTMRAENHSAIVHTAAASTLGQMLVKYCASESVPLVNIVRRDEQVAQLKAIGAVHVVNSSSESFERDLIDAINATGATLAFDATGGGDLAEKILKAMEIALTENAPPQTYGSTTHKQLYLYGALQSGLTTLSRSYGMAWGVGGWLMPNWYASGKGDRVAAVKAFMKGIDTTFKTEYAQKISLDEAVTLAVVQDYAKQATGFKYLITPNAAHAGQ